MRWYWWLTAVVAFVGIVIYGYLDERKERQDNAAAKARAAKAEKRIQENSGGTAGGME